MKNKVLSYARKAVSLYGYQDAFHFLIYAIFSQKRLLQWFEFIETKLEGFSETTKTRLAMRPVSRFIRPWLTLSEKVDILTCHYRTLTTSFSSQALAALESEQGIVLAEMTGRSGKKYTMILRSLISKDGALMVAFRGEDIGRLASITGILGPDENNGFVFWIGALQGGTPMKAGNRKVVQETDGKRLVSETTKDLNGLRPKQAVLNAICALSECFHVKKIIAPSLKNQIAIKDWRKGRSALHTDYDTFWEEYTGGKAEANGDYCLPLPLPRRQLADVQQKRRKDWLLRYERIDALSASIAETFKKLKSFP